MEWITQLAELGELGTAALVVVGIIVISWLVMFGVLPLMRGLWKARERLSEEQQEFYEKTVIPTLKGLAENLQNTLVEQRTLYEAKLSEQRTLYEVKLTNVEKERNAERDKLVREITLLTEKVQLLTQRIEKLELENRAKDDEILRLKEELNKIIAERDGLKAELAAMDAMARMKLEDGTGTGRPADESIQPATP